MMKKLFSFYVCVILALGTFAQSGNAGIATTATPASRPTVSGSFAASYRIETSTAANIGANDYYVSYNGAANGTLTLPAAASGAGNFLGRVYNIKNTSSFVLTVAASGAELLDNQRGAGVAHVTVPAGYYAMIVSKGTISGTTWEVALIANSGVSGDATRLLAGTIGAKFAQSSGSSSTASNPAAISPIGGIDITIGSGYTVSNPGNGDFVIMFTVPFTQIYGVTATLVDAYGTSGGVVSAGTAPDFSTQGTRLKTTDNTQISLLSNTTIRIKTVDASGNPGNRPFTFLVMGK